MSASASSVASCELKTNHQNTDSKDLIKVKLKKPKSWNWELSTSKSSSSIQFPEIQLYDHKNNFLASANDADLVLGNNTTNSVSTNLKKANVVTPIENISPRSESTKRKHYPVNKDVREFIDELTTQMNRNGYECLINSQNNRNQSKGNEFSNKFFGTNVNGIDFSDVKNILQTRPQTAPNDHNDINIQNKNTIAIKKSKSTTAVLSLQAFDSKKGENIKKKYRRTYSTSSSMRFSSSILERLSVNQLCSSSSTDTQSNCTDTKKQELSLEEDDSSAYKTPKYVLRSSHAGTLVVYKDSFLTHGKLRRRTNNDVSLTQDDTALQNNNGHSNKRQRVKMMQRRKDKLDKNTQNERNDILSSESDVNMLKETQRSELRRIRKSQPNEIASSTNIGE